MISYNFLENTPDQMRSFTEYCERRGWLQFPGDTYDGIRIKARKLVERCVKLGFIKFPVGAPLVENEAARIRSLVCGGKLKAHKWIYLAGVGTCCGRCNALPTRRHNRRTTPLESPTASGLPSPPRTGRGIEGEVSNPVSLSATRSL